MVTQAIEAAATTALMSFRFLMPKEDDPLVWESGDWRRKAQRVTIKTEKGKMEVNDMLIRVKGLLKDAEEKKDQLLKPVKEQLVRPMERFFKDIIGPLEDAERMFKRALSDYLMKKEEEMRELAAILKDVDSANSIVPLAPEIKLESEDGKSVAVDVWKFGVEDVSKVPIQYLRQAVETTRGKEALDQVIRGTVAGGIRTIPGVRIYPEKTIVVTLK